MVARFGLGTIKTKKAPRFLLVSLYTTEFFLICFCCFPNGFLDLTVDYGHKVRNWISSQGCLPWTKTRNYDEDDCMVF
jgi:hypothetical protein